MAAPKTAPKAAPKSIGVQSYLAALPPERRSALSAVRRVIRDRLPRGFQEGILYGMISYYVPLSRHPDTYNGQPLLFAALGAHKSTLSLYLMNLYSDPKLLRWFEDQFEKSGKKLRMGKSCVRFKALDDLPLDLIGETIGKTSLERFVTHYENTLRQRQSRRVSKNSPVKKRRARPSRS
jgi:hypothetical protein